MFDKTKAKVQDKVKDTVVNPMRNLWVVCLTTLGMVLMTLMMVIGMK
jgi:hypothetical protein